MRDTFLLLWVGFLVVGVIGSIVSSIRKQTQHMNVEQPAARRMPPQRVILVPPPPPEAPKQQRVIPSATPSEARGSSRRTAPAPELPHDFPAVRRPRRPQLFRDGKAIVQAVIAAEVLGKPRGLRDEYF